MANKTPNTAKLEPFTSETARVAARKSAEKRAQAEPLKPVSVKVFARQHAEIIRRGENLSELVRRLLDEHLNT